MCTTRPSAPTSSWARWIPSPSLAASTSIYPQIAITITITFTNGKVVVLAKVEVGCESSRLEAIKVRLRPAGESAEPHHNCIGVLPFYDRPQAARTALQQRAVHSKRQPSLVPAAAAAAAVT